MIVTGTLLQYDTFVRR